MDKDRKKELNEQFAQTKKFMGVFKITNLANGKIFIDGSLNLKNQWDRVKMALNSNMHVNAALQRDWNESGEKDFAFEVLEEAEVKDGIIDKKFELSKMEQSWLEKLQPYGDVGYNKPK